MTKYYSHKPRVKVK